MKSRPFYISNYNLSMSYSGGDTTLAPLKGELSNAVRLRGLFVYYQTNRESFYNPSVTLR